jgi:O-antigen chain-terminating methyltransferase
MKTEKAVRNLPEVYQPIFGRPDLSKEVSRESTQRLIKIEETYSRLLSSAGKPLRVLDLGCAQGYMSFSLAELGAEVVGMDFLQENIDVCNALAEENRHLNIQFQKGDIVTEAPKVKPGDFDLIIGLSVWHHVIYSHGLPHAKELISHRRNSKTHDMGRLLIKFKALNCSSLVSFVHHI